MDESIFKSTSRQVLAYRISMTEHTTRSSHPRKLMLINLIFRIGFSFQIKAPPTRCPGTPRAQVLVPSLGAFTPPPATPPAPWSGLRAHLSQDSPVPRHRSLGWQHVDCARSQVWCQHPHCQIICWRSIRERLSSAPLARSVSPDNMKSRQLTVGL